MKRTKKVKTYKRIKPEVQLIGRDGNVFLLLGACVKALRKEGLNKEKIEMQQKVFKALSYGNVLRIMNDYVDIV